MKRLYDSLPRWRRPVLVALALLSAALMSQIPELEAVFAPEELVPARPEEAALAERAFGGFTGREEPLLVVLEAPDALDPAVLGYLHTAARHFQSRPWAARVDGLTVTALPHAPRAEAVGLDELDEADPATDPETEDALSDIVGSEPTRFPMGLASLSRGAPALGPLVEGEDLDEAERAAIVEAVESGVLDRRLIDAERRVTQLVIAPRPMDEDAARAAVEETEAWLAGHSPPEGVMARVGGLPAVRVAMIEALEDDQVLLVGLAVMGSLIVLIIGFRSWAGVLLPLGAAGMTAGMTVGAMAWLGEPLNLLNNVVPPLLITIGLGDAVHLLVRHREELRRDPDRIAAARRTMRAMVGACFLTSATTAVGFGSLAISETGVLRRFGVTAALGVMLAYLVTVLFLPAALPDFRVTVREPRPRMALETWIPRLAAAVSRRSGWVIGGSCALLLLSVATAGRLRVDSALLDQLPPDSDTARTAALLEDRLGGVRVLEVGLMGAPGRYRSAEGLRELDALERWLAEQPHVLRVSGAAGLTGSLWAWIDEGDDRPAALADDGRAQGLAALAAHSAPERWATYVSADGGRARVEVRLADAGERALNQLLDRAEARGRELPEAELVLGGEAVRSARGLERLVGELVVSLAAAVLIIFVLLGLLLRSVRLGLISVLPNVLPLTLTLAWMAIRGIPLHAATAIVFTVSIGLAVDGTVHILARYREEISEGQRRMRGMILAMRGSGRAVVIGAMTLLLGFLALLFGSFVPIRLFAELSVVAIGTSLLAELILLPALLARFGPTEVTGRAMVRTKLEHSGEARSPYAR